MDNYNHYLFGADDVKFASTRAKKINSISNKMKRHSGAAAAGGETAGYEVLAQNFAGPPGMPVLTEHDLSTSLDPSLKRSTRNIQRRLAAQSMATHAASDTDGVTDNYVSM